MKRKKILLIFPGSLFPITMASQNHVYNIIKRLSEDHTIDVVNLIRSKDELVKTHGELKNICNKYIPIFKINPKNSLLKKALHRILYKYYYYLLGYSARYYYLGNKRIIKKISKIIGENNYNVVQIEFWYQGDVFRELDSRVFKVIDTIDVMHEKKQKILQDKYGAMLPYFAHRELKVYEWQEKEMLNMANLVISISEIDYARLTKISPDNDNILIPIGNVVNCYPSYNNNKNENIILFYGNMGNDQNINAFHILKDKIFPIIRNRIPDARILVLGANPPNSILDLNSFEYIDVTGYVEDVFQYIKKAKVMILPLQISAGFRGRIIDVMAMGVPVIGTHSALDCINMVHGLHGFITDSNEDMAKYAVKILKDYHLMKKLGENCIDFINKKYSIESTYGKLSKYYLDLKI